MTSGIEQTELAPFGSDEGYTALYEFRDWRKENPELDLLGCIAWIVNDLRELSLEEFAYGGTLLMEKIKRDLEDPTFDIHYHYFTFDITIIATGFGQLVDEGTIDKRAKPFIEISIDRQLTICKIDKDRSLVWSQR